MIFKDLESAVCNYNDKTKPTCKLNYILIHLYKRTQYWNRHIITGIERHLAKYYIAHLVYMYDL